MLTLLFKIGVLIISAYIFFPDYTFKIWVCFKTIIKNISHVIYNIFFIIYKDILYFIEYIKNDPNEFLNFILDFITDFLNFTIFFIKIIIILIEITTNFIVICFYILIVVFVDIIYDYLVISDINPLLYFDVVFTITHLLSVIFLDIDFSKNLEKKFIYLPDSKISFRFYIYIKLFLTGIGFNFIYILYKYKLNLSVDYYMIFIWFFFLVISYFYIRKLFFYYSNTYYNEKRINKLFSTVGYSICFNIYMFFFFF